MFFEQPIRKYVVLTVQLQCKILNLYFFSVPNNILRLIFLWVFRSNNLPSVADNLTSVSDRQTVYIFNFSRNFLEYTSETNNDSLFLLSPPQNLL